MTPIVSIIIPCYNSGEYLPDALSSVRQYPDKRVYEIIVVDDGSKDPLTLQLLKELKKEGEVQVIHQENQGPAAARNTGVRASKGKYLLLLDADNRIRPAYIDRGIKIMDANPRVGVVYGTPFFFGEAAKKRRYKVKPFDMQLILMHNYIDNCAVVRKQTWEELGGQDEHKAVMGYEDWEFWIRVGTSKYTFHFVDEVLYEYRIRAGSLITESNHADKQLAMKQYIFSKHQDLFIQHHEEVSRKYRYHQKAPFEAFLKQYLRRFFPKKKK